MNISNPFLFPFPREVIFPRKTPREIRSSRCLHADTEPKTVSSRRIIRATNPEGLLDNVEGREAPAPQVGMTFGGRRRVGMQMSRPAGAPKAIAGSGLCSLRARRQRRDYAYPSCPRYWEY
ncbi:hypothetical protein EVAR_34396_1 [Eumeta japonica]|uniref:Uncharacterized protein n=1 Tax=Eumeta variegata TaxID=151549 RepID=A0A4C1WY15_EUMVA|nr:hypothetical protein EVAR_34396_1 [Eumeta japonica]